jgi:hypothetical protein
MSGRDEIRLITFDLAEIGRLAVDAERARKRHVAAKAAHREACRAFYDAGGVRYVEPSAYSGESETHTNEYDAATGPAYRAYREAANAAGAAKRRVISAVAKFDAASTPNATLPDVESGR